MGFMTQGPGYSMSDLAWWAGFIGGTAGVYTILENTAELHRILNLVIAIVCGMGCGFVLEKIYKNTMKGKRNRDAQNQPPF